MPILRSADRSGQRENWPGGDEGSVPDDGVVPASRFHCGAAFPTTTPRGPAPSRCRMIAQPGARGQGAYGARPTGRAAPRWNRCKPAWVHFDSPRSRSRCRTPTGLRRIGRPPRYLPVRSRSRAVWSRRALDASARWSRCSSPNPVFGITQSPDGARRSPAAPAEETCTLSCDDKKTSLHLRTACKNPPCALPERARANEGLARRAGGPYDGKTASTAPGVCWAGALPRRAEAPGFVLATTECSAPIQTSAKRAPAARALRSRTRPGRDSRSR